MMSLLQPTDGAVYARAVVDNLVVASDPDARRSGLYYWELARPWTSALEAAVTTAADPIIRTRAGKLLADPGDPPRYAALYQTLAEYGERPALAEMLAIAWQAECHSRIGFHLGARYTRDTAAPVTAGDLQSLPPGVPLPGGTDPEVLIVVPFRDRDTGGERLRNLLACLLALRDQSFPRVGYRVTVVESDDRPRWRDVVARYADHYLFAPKPGPFNKSWAVNVGVVHTPGDAQVLCILDADVLCDRAFIARNVARFRRPGTAGHLPYRDMFCLDASATAWAIRQRLLQGTPEVDPDGLRGFLLRRPPGCCVWVRAAAYHRIGGMDERYEGWGGEDNDFMYRLDFSAAVDSYRDWLLHMRHPPASVLQEDGELVNAHIPALSWRPDAPIGQLDRFVAAGTRAGSPA